jgi:hypothetical protein
LIIFNNLDVHYQLGDSLGVRGLYLYFFFSLALLYFWGFSFDNLIPTSHFFFKKKLAYFVLPYPSPNKSNYVTCLCYEYFYSWMTNSIKLGIIKKILNSASSNRQLKMILKHTLVLDKLLWGPKFIPCREVCTL